MQHEIARVNEGEAIYEQNSAAAHNQRA